MKRPFQIPKCPTKKIGATKKPIKQVLIIKQVLFSISMPKMPKNVLLTHLLWSQIFGFGRHIFVSKMIVSKRHVLVSLEWPNVSGRAGHNFVALPKAKRRVTELCPGLTETFRSLHGDLYSTGVYIGTAHSISAPSGGCLPPPQEIFW